MRSRFIAASSVTLSKNLLMLYSYPAKRAWVFTPLPTVMLCTFHAFLNYREDTDSINSTFHNPPFQCNWITLFPCSNMLLTDCRQPPVRHNSAIIAQVSLRSASAADGRVSHLRHHVAQTWSKISPNNAIYRSLPASQNPISSEYFPFSFHSYLPRT